ncbi:hypothetical protein [Halalkalibacter okhensis]|nr:hypothetical protein [Halalkalibacter okhensis]
MLKNFLNKWKGKESKNSSCCHVVIKEIQQPSSCCSEGESSQK